jgi:hypothetical protein
MISSIRSTGYASPFGKSEILEAKLQPNKYASMQRTVNTTPLLTTTLERKGSEGYLLGY